MNEPLWSKPSPQPSPKGRGDLSASRSRWLAAHECRNHQRGEYPADYDGAKLHQHVRVAKAPPGPFIDMPADKNDHTDRRHESNAGGTRKTDGLQQQQSREHGQDKLSEKLDHQRRSE